MPYPRSKKNKKVLSQAYAFCKAKIKNKSKLERCVYKIYEEKKKVRRLL